MNRLLDDDFYGTGNPNNNNGAAGLFWTMSLDLVSSASATVILCDAKLFSDPTHTNHLAAPARQLANEYTHVNPTNLGDVDFRHSDSATALYADMHAGASQNYTYEQFTPDD
ncbi:MAG: hypothetical protein AAF797_06430 [Planctomycetota bacterium]